MVLWHKLSLPYNAHGLSELLAFIQVGFGKSPTHNFCNSAVL